MQSISRMPHLADLQLSTQWTDVGAGALCGALPALTRLFFGAPDDALCAIAALSRCAALQSLSLTDHQASPAWVGTLAATLGACTQLKSPPLYYLAPAEEVVRVDAPVDMRAAFQALSACRQLRKVDVRFTSLGPDGATLLCTVLQHHPALKDVLLFDAGC